MVEEGQSTTCLSLAQAQGGVLWELSQHPDPLTWRRRAQKDEEVEGALRGPHCIEGDLGPGIATEVPRGQLWLTCCLG